MDASNIARRVKAVVLSASSVLLLAATEGCTGAPTTVDLAGASSGATRPDAAPPPAQEAGSPVAPGDDDGAATQAPEAAVADDATGGDDAAPEADASADDGSPVEDAGGAVSPDAGDDASLDAGAPQVTLTVDVAFFGWADNAPPGDEIAYPKSGGFPTLHEVAAGTGTYADPLTFGGDSKVFPPGTILYVPYIEKYVMLEDECVSCATQAVMTHRPEIAVWMASDGTTPSALLSKCESFWTRSSVAVIEAPPADLAVTSRPLLDAPTKACRTTP
jgi:hypothetical protein